MMNKGVAITYGDVAPEAKENFKPESTSSKFDTLSQLQQYNLNFPNYANPCELYSVVLDGTASAFPSVPENANLGLWSEQISNNDGTFTNPITLTLTSEGQYSSQGFTFTFDTYNNIYPTHINIKWFRYAEGTMTELSPDGGVDFYPDNAFYFCHNFVENYNKVVITFHSLNMPKNRLKLRAIDYGYGTVFYGNELRNVKLIQELDPISSQISINTADFTLDSRSDMEYRFQQKQPLSIFFNGELKATTFVKKSTRKAKRLWDIQSEDYIGLLESIPYHGDIYTNAKVTDVLDDIFKTAKVPYSIDDVFADATVTGYIPYTTSRDALMQVAFAIQAVVDTSNSDVIKVFALEEDVKQTVPLGRIMQGQNFTDEEIVTGVEISMHTYTPKEVIPENKIGLYDPDIYGYGKEVLIKFPEPVHGLYSSGDGEIISSSANHALVNAKNWDFRLVGYGYEKSVQLKKKNREDVGVSTIEKIISIDDATLISPENVDNVLGKCYNWLIKTNATNLKIVEGKHIQYGKGYKYGQHKYGTFKYGQKYPNIITYDKPVNVGENINAETEYLGVVGGRLIKQSFNLNGNIIVKEAVLK